MKRIQYTGKFLKEKLDAFKGLGSNNMTFNLSIEKKVRFMYFNTEKIFFKY